LCGHLNNLLLFWFQASATMLMKSAVFWGITWHRVVILYRHCGTWYRARNVGKQLPHDAV
jgi:hypothetical protein